MFRTNPKIRDFDDIDIRIQNVVDEEPFLSVGQVTTRKRITKINVFYKMTEKIGYVSKHRKWVLHLFSEEQKKKKKIE